MSRAKNEGKSRTNAAKERAVTWGIPAVAVALSIVAMLVTFLAGQGMFGAATNADALYLPALFKDVLGSHNSIDAWFLTPAPYFFPDMVLFLPAYILGKTCLDQIAIYLLIQTSVTFFLLYALIRQLVQRERFAVASLIFVVFAFLCLEVRSSYIHLTFSAHHYGAFLATLATVTLTLLQIKSESIRQRYGCVAVLCCLEFLSVLSDGLFLVQVTLPLFFTIVAVGWFSGREHRKAGFLWEAVLPLLAGGAGAVVYKIVVAHTTRYHTSIGFTEIGSRLGEFRGMLGKLYGLHPVFFFLLVLGILTTTVLLYKRRNIILTPQIKLVVLFVVISCAMVTTAVLIVETLIPSTRYFIPVFFWPPIIFFVLLSNYLICCRYALSWGTLFLAGLLLFHSVNVLIKEENGDTPTMTSIQCLDAALRARAMHHGIATYWDAKPIQEFSNHDLVIGQYDNNLKEYHWITSLSFYRECYDFAIVRDDSPADCLSKEKLLQLNGPPKEIISCGKYSLWVYGKGRLRVR